MKINKLNLKKCENLGKIKEEMKDAKRKLSSFFSQKRKLVGMEEIPEAKLEGYLMALGDINIQRRFNLLNEKQHEINK